MEECELWHKWVLITLWSVCLLPSTQSCTYVLASFSHSPYQFLQLPWHTHIYYAWFLICLGLEIMEMRNFTLNRLKPLFYLASQTFQCAVYSLATLLVAREWRPSASARKWNTVAASLKASPFYISFAYAFYIYCTARQRERLLNTKYRPSGIHTASRQSTSVTLPVRINSATWMVAEMNTLVRVVRWVKADPQWLERLPHDCQTGLKHLLFGLRCVASYIPLIILLPFHDRLPGEPRHKQVKFKSTSLDDWDYPKPSMARGEFGHVKISSQPDLDLESASEAVHLHPISQGPRHLQRATTPQTHHRHGSSTRLLGPRYLCFLNDAEKDKSGSYTITNVQDWLAQNNTEASPDYVFLSYTRMQFFTQTTFDPKLPQHRLNTLKEAAAADKAILTKYGVAAARNMGVPAFWVDFECVRPEESDVDGADMEDVYRICDIVRAAHSLSVVLGPSIASVDDPKTKTTPHKSEWFNEWGRRMWTVPEALLCPSEHRIAVYDVRSAEPELIAKRNLAGRVWDDAGALRQLIDHYEASLHLTQLELISIALECLQRRQTDTRNAGDVAYVLMGLLRLRPKVNKTDSDFQAFARLSLANDSDKFLERILCLHSLHVNSTWHDMNDVWDAKLWHIDPLYQIADVSNDSDAVVIGDALGTVIDWTSLKMVDFQNVGHSHETYFYMSRWAAKLAASLLLSFLWWIFEAIPAFESIEGYRFASLFYEILVRGLIGPWLLTMLIATQTPALLAKHFDREFVATQARIFGIQGQPDLKKAETMIFGSSRGRFQWNTSNYQREYDANDEREEYTLIDTLTCTATSFCARKAPTIAFVGAREGGLLRTLLCSYDEVAGVFVKETVVRMSSTISQRLQRLDRFRFAVAASPRYRDVVPSRSSVDYYDDDAIEIPDIPEFRSLSDCWQS